MSNDPHTDDPWVALYMAAVAVVDEWGDGDNIDPDRMDNVVGRLAVALEVADA